MMKHHLPILLLTMLTAWMTATMLRIEMLNAQAGRYLPRTDGDADGKWRISPHRQPRDQLRGLVETIGLLQYPLALIAIVASLLLLMAPHSTRPTRRLATICGILAAICLIMAIHRGYFSSLGW